MNAGKSTSLLQSSYNFHKRDMNTLVLAPELDDRHGVGKVNSQIGLEANALAFTHEHDLLNLISAAHANN